MNPNMATFTVTEAVDHIGFNIYQFLLMVLIALGYMADSMEILILSILSPALHCEWGISGVQQATLTTVVFLGMVLSSSFWGSLGDKYGRRRMLVWAIAFLGYFGLLSSLSPSFWWLLGLRFLVGFFIGSVPQIITICAEFLPSPLRGSFVLGMTFAWSFGAFFEALLGYLVMDSLGWRYLILFSTVPTLLFVMLAPCLLPESAYFLADTGRTEEAEENLRKVAKCSNSELPPGHLQPEDREKLDATRGNFTALFNSNKVNSAGGEGDPPLGQNGHLGPRLAISVFFIWFGCAFAYYGLVLLSTVLLDSSAHHCSSGHTTVAAAASRQEEQQCHSHVCKGLTTQDYLNLVYTTSGEFPGVILALLLIDKLGRVKTIALLSFLYTVATVSLLFTCGMGQVPLIVSLFAARAFSTAAFQMIYLITIEAYPTNLRAVAMGSGSGMARFGAMMTPYVAQVLILESVSVAVIVYAILGFFMFLVCVKFPVETKGMALDETGAAKKQDELKRR